VDRVPTDNFKMKIRFKDKDRDTKAKATAEKYQTQREGFPGKTN